MSWSAGGVYDKTKSKSKRHSDVASTGYEKTKVHTKLNESMPNNYENEDLKPKLPDSVAKARKDIRKKGTDLMADVKADMNKQEEKHRAQVVELEEKWKTKVKQVLHISHEKITEAEEKLQNQMEENEGLARSNSRLKESVEVMKENQAIFQEVRLMGKELKSLRKQIVRQEDFLIESRKDHEQMNADLYKISEDKSSMTALVVQMAETDQRAALLNIELEQRRIAMDRCMNDVLYAESKGVKWQRVCLVEAVVVLASLSFMAFLFWRR